jgi:LasA protease
MRVVGRFQQNLLSFVILSSMAMFPLVAGGGVGNSVNAAAPFGTREQQVFNSDAHASSQSDSWEYFTQSGDTLKIIAARFQVNLDALYLVPRVPADQLLDPGQIVRIHRPEVESSLGSFKMPDAEVVYSPSAANFSTQDYVAGAGGFLESSNEYMRSTGLTPEAEIIQRVAIENSINPRLLLSLLEYQCGCLTGPLRAGVQPDNLMKISDPLRRGLYRQLGWTVNQLSLGYYGWRQGLLHNLVLLDGSVVSLSPDLNAGSAAVAYLFSRLLDADGWHQAMDPEDGFISLHEGLFPQVWDGGNNQEELYPAGLAQPNLILPFEIDREWSFTSGPHQAWETEGATAALDFAPASERYGCEPSAAWVLAAADGIVVRSANNAVVLDFDGDGVEQTGWSLLYMHVADFQRVSEGTTLKQGDRIGHPSCEGGPADGTHVHLARKYNGEWIAAGGPLPFMMSDWIAEEGYRPYEGSLVRGDQVVQANPLSPAAAFISRTQQDPPAGEQISRDLWWEE